MANRFHQTSLVLAAAPPSIPSPLRLTEYDLATVPLFVLRGAWLFDKQLDAERLREGLARVLSLYPSLAGRMTPDAGIALCNRGVPFTVSRNSARSVQDIVAKPALAHRFADRLHPLRFRKGREPLLKVTLTLLRDGSLLNVSCSHLCLDGHAFYAFVQSWARASTGRSVATPILDPSRLPSPGDRPKDEVVKHAMREGWHRIRGGTVLRMVLLSVLGRLGGRTLAARFSARGLRRMRRAAIAESRCAGLRTFEALSAHLTLACARLVRLPPRSDCKQVTIVDARQRIPSLPPEYAGNAALAVQTACFPVDSSLGEAAARIHRGLDPFLVGASSRPAEFVTLARETIRHKAYFAPYDLAAMHASPPTLSYINNFATLPVYAVDFGTEGDPITPVHVFPHDLPDPVLIWPAPPGHDGVEVYLAGAYARALRRLAPDDPWHAELRRFEEEPAQAERPGP